ncbi:hypothetical protein [Caulobacter sp. DWR2-3-1b2]|uniref:hypothetical protein n=1 Tax=unclassified Caulobacter TaxID=2648921 RepID=UPI003CE6B904
MGKPWFRVKRFGYGAGLPVSWEGWAVLAVFLILILAISMLGVAYSVSHPVAYAAAIIAPSIPLLWIAWRKSDKPWKWRNGGD